MVLGKDNCAEFKSELDRAGLQTIFLEKPGRIRENLTLHCADQPETRISFSGFPADDSLLDEVSEYLLAKETITGEELMAYVNADKQKPAESEEATEE